MTGEHSEPPSRRTVRATYDRIGDHFASTRVNPWPEIQSFVDGRDVAIAGDIGCGNGRHAEVLLPCAGTVIGIDASRTMLRTARERLAETEDVRLLVGDASRVPIRAGTLDLALYIATLHHLPSTALRRRSLAELNRVLRPNGAALISAWSTTHDRFDRATSFDTTVDWSLPDGRTVERYYHIYTPADFEGLLGSSPLAVDRVWTSSGNCYAVARGG